MTDKALDSQVINRHKVVTALQCSDYCLREPFCYGFNLETMKEKKMCELLRFGSNIVDRPGFSYWIFNRVSYEKVSAYSYIQLARGRGVLDISLGGEVRRGPSYPDPV